MGYFPIILHSSIIFTLFIFFTTRTIWWFEFRLLNLLFLNFRIIFNYSIIIIIFGDFLNFPNMSIILNLILSSTRFRFIAKSQYNVFSWMNFISMIFYFYVVITVQVFHLLLKMYKLNL